MLTKRPDETVTQFTIRQMRAEFLEEAAKIALEFESDTDPDAGTIIAEAIREAARA